MDPLPGSYAPQKQACGNMRYELLIAYLQVLWMFVLETIIMGIDIAMIYTPMVTHAGLSIFVCCNSSDSCAAQVSVG